VTSWRDPDRAERVDRFRKSGPTERAVLEEYVKAGSYVSRETGPDTLSRSIRGMAPEGGATEKPEKAAFASCSAGAEESLETLFDLEAARRRVTTNSPVPYLPPVRSGKNQSWHNDKPDPVNPGTGWMRRR
jgi:hypothetical protein